MINRRWMLLGTAVAGLFGMRWATSTRAIAETTFEVEKTDAEWRKILSPAQYEILRAHGTEPPYSSPLNKEKRPGMFVCAACELPLFASETKFESGTGWPSFYQPFDNAVGTKADYTYFMKRTEVHCRRCGGHLGHVFDDGPRPTGLRYCMNGLSLKFIPSASGPA